MMKKRPLCVLCGRLEEKEDCHYCDVCYALPHETAKELAKWNNRRSEKTTLKEKKPICFICIMFEEKADCRYCTMHYVLKLDVVLSILMWNKQRSKKISKTEQIITLKEKKIKKRPLCIICNILEETDDGDYCTTCQPLSYNVAKALTIWGKQRSKKTSKTEQAITLKEKKTRKKFLCINCKIWVKKKNCDYCTICDAL